MISPDHHSKFVRSMSQQNPQRPLSLLFLLLQALTMTTLAIPLTNPISLLNSTINPTASMPSEQPISQNATSPSLPQNMFDYHVVGTSIVLRISETGHLFTEIAVNKIIDAAIRKVVAKINTGSGNESIEGGRFWMLTAEIDMRITALANEELTYYLLGDVLAGAWQYMSQPWSSFREIVFDIVLDRGGWDYIGYGRFAKYGPFPPPPSPEPSSSLSRNTNPVLNEIE